MASRKELKEQRRRERQERERVAAQSARRERRLTIVSGALAVLTVAGAATALALTRSGGGRGDPFAANPEGLEQRVRDARFAPGRDHVHPTVTVFIGNRRISVPLGIGGADMAATPIHRHLDNEFVHAEGINAAELTLAQLMRLWDVPLSPTQLGPYRADGERSVRMWVKQPNGSSFRPNRAFGSLKLRDRQQVYLYYGTSQQAPIAS